MSSSAHINGPQDYPRLIYKAHSSLGQEVQSFITQRIVMNIKKSRWRKRTSNAVLLEDVLGINVILVIILALM